MKIIKYKDCNEDDDNYVDDGDMPRLGRYCIGR